VSKVKKNKKDDEKKDERKCLNLKKLMEEKLKDLTDLKSRLASLAKEEASKQLKKAIKNTEAENLLTLIENIKKEYEQVKELYEKCIMELSVQKTTLLYLYKPQEKKVLLAMKKRGFGTGKWNGVGGKLDKGEIITEALVRETKEEIDVVINKNDLAQVATLNFGFKDNQDWNQQVHAFIIEKWKGEPKETEEMIPRWYPIKKLPYENMWVDDVHWLPLVFEGKKINASFNFDKTGDKILNMKIEKI
jgi:ADP-ribose pyrophosphatase YjhB (NUDIX family)